MGEGRGQNPGEMYILRPHLSLRDPPELRNRTVTVPEPGSGALSLFLRCAHKALSTRPGNTSLSDTVLKKWQPSPHHTHSLATYCVLGITLSPKDPEMNKIKGVWALLSWSSHAGRASDSKQLNMKKQEHSKEWQCSDEDVARWLGEGGGTLESKVGKSPQRGP